MGIRDKYRASVQPHLEPGEQIQSVFGAQTHSAWLMVLTGVIPFIFFNTYVVVTVTDRRIILGKASAFATSKIKEVIDTVPRQTTIGPASGLWYKTEALGRRLFVHKRFHGDVNEADALIASVGGTVAATELPPPPAP